MSIRRRIARLLSALLLAHLVSLGGSCRAAGQEAKEQIQGTKDARKEKEFSEGKKGAAVGLLVTRAKDFIEVKLDGEQKVRKYVPPWKGGLPSRGGGFDRDVLKIIRELKAGSRVEVEWVFLEERLRVLNVKVLIPAEK